MSITDTNAHEQVVCNASLEELASLLLDHDNFFICGHVHPDGDCIGSTLALTHALRACGKEATPLLVAEKANDAGLAFLPGYSEMHCVQTVKPRKPFTFVSVDVPTPERLGRAAEFIGAAQRVFMLDHHPAIKPFAHHYYIDPTSASCSLLLWQVIKHMCSLASVAVPYESAVCAYTGLVTDTGGFAYSNTDIRAHLAAAELLQLGVAPEEVSNNIFNSKTPAALALTGIALRNMKIDSERGFSLSYITREDLETLHAQAGDTECLIEAVRQVAGIRVACMLREEAGCVRGSLRSKDATDVSVLATSYGGGGHAAAAGFTLACTLDEARQRVEADIQALLRR